MSQATQRVGQYNFLKKLGAGRMAEVYLGRIEGAEGFQKPVAIKKILPDLATDIGFVQSLIAEAKVGGQLHHRNIVEVYDFIRYGNDYCIIMEYVDGVDLGRILRSARRYRVRIPPAAALYIASQVCDGLDYAHSARGFNGEPLSIIHRDLKPSNILISIKGGVKISDFGIARVMEAALARTGGSAKISYQYQSPEQATGGATTKLTSASDIFSIGVILFEMLTLEPLFPGRNVLEVLEGLREADLGRRLALAQRQLPGSEKILAMALNPNPADRYRSASLMAEDLRRLLVYMKVDDPRERLVTFFARLVRFVQEQGKKPAEGQSPDGEEWEVETRVGSAEDGSSQQGAGATLSGVEIENSVPAWAPPVEEPALAVGNGGPVASSEPEMPMPGSQGADHWGRRPEETAPRPPPVPGYGAASSREDTAGLPGWRARESEPGAGGYGGVSRVDEPTPLRAVHEETKFGTYETVEQGGYGVTASLPPPAPPAPPHMPIADSTRIISVADIPPPPPAFMPQGNAPADPWAAASNGTQILTVPPEYMAPPQAVAPVKKRSKLPFVAAAVVVALVLGGGGYAYFSHSGSGESTEGQQLRCPTCNYPVPAGVPFCPHCGAKLGDGAQVAPEGIKCPHCGEMNEPGAKFCSACGKPLH